MRGIFAGSLALLLAGLVVATPLHEARSAATIVVQNNDGAGEGFNDPAAFVPVGGNPAVTRGQARLNAFQYAANLWGAALNSNVTIIVAAQMNPQFCDAGSAVLGSAGAVTVHGNFANAPILNTWYPQALANSLANVDLDPASPDISATFNSSINGVPGCLAGWNWYYGYDANPPANHIDFVSVVLHEIGHGLGFQTFCNLATGAKFGGFNDMYMVKLQQDNDPGVPINYSTTSNAGRIAANIDDPDLRWIGTEVTNAAAALPVTAGLDDNFVRVHAPNPLVQGSSVSHFSTALLPNQLMEPSYVVANHNLGLALPLMQDIGWSIVVPCAPAPTTAADTDTLTVAQTLTTWDLQVEVTNTGGNPAVNLTGTLLNGPGWLSITDANCAYGTVNGGNSSFGSDNYTLDITAWPGGSFSVDLQLDWEDACGNTYQETVTVDLLPATLPTPVGGHSYAYRLLGNMPNPFNPSTTIRYEIAGNDRVTLNVYDVSGGLVRTLVNQQQSRGTHEARWDGRDNRGRSVASGVYFYRMNAGSFSETRRMVLLK